MKELIQVLDIVGEKEWFRRKMGMTKGGSDFPSNDALYIYSRIETL